MDPSAASVELARRYPRCRTQTAPGYPQRVPVPDEKCSWDAEYPGYAPPYFVADKVLAQDGTKVPGGWADPEGDGAGPHRTPCPMGRTGIAGRGLLGRWGINAAVDVVLLAWHDNALVTLLIERSQPVLRNGVWHHPLALPGGMVDVTETAPAAMTRELLEETGVMLGMSPADGARMLGQGPVDDPRTTDHAWIETTAAYRFVAPSVWTGVLATMKAADDARGVAAHPVTAALLAGLYASHGRVLGDALADLAGRTDVPAAVGHSALGLVARS